MIRSLTTGDRLRSYLRRRLFAVTTLATLIVAACIISTTNRPAPLATAGAARWVDAPIKAHMTDGAVVLFRSGSTVGGGKIAGHGMRFNARLDSNAVEQIPLDSVIGVEAFERQVNPARSLLYVPVSGVIAAAATVALAIAIFGSCPTIYADSAGVNTLQAESFSYSIAPLLAKRDIDRLDVQPDANGVIRLEVRNEALETHYIEQIELLEARHRRDEVVMPVARGGLAALRNVLAPAAVTDSRGRDVRNEVATADRVLFASAPDAVDQGANGGSAEEHLDLVVPRAAGRDTLALMLDMRASLLSTTIFYDHMLKQHGARSLDWVGKDLSRITTVAQVAKWYTDNFGLRVLVQDGTEWRQVVRLMDFGPAAWRTVAAVIPDLKKMRGDSIHVRLSFVTDEYQIDRIGTTWDVRPVEMKKVEVARVTESSGMRRDDMRDFIRRTDDRRLITTPGSRFYTYFDVGKNPPEPMARTFLAAVDGYYVEWVRPSWIATARDSTPFSPHTTKREILATWLATRDSLQQRFFRDRVPVQ